jgi:hypothetical protein
MNQIVNAEALVSAVPLDKPAVKPMTRREKLLHWASIVRKIEHVHIYHMLEHWDAQRLADPIDGPGYDRYYRRRGLFTTALADPIFREQGLVGSQHDNGLGQVVSPQQVMDFFELTQAELHEFSCNCGGNLTGKMISDRIKALAGPAPAGGSPTLLDRAKNLFGR